MMNIQQGILNIEGTDTAILLSFDSGGRARYFLKMNVPNLDLPPLEKMSRRKKWRIAIVLLGIFGVIGWMWLRDDALEDDSDLVLGLSDVPEDENGMRFFEEVVKRFDWMDDDFEKLEEMLSKDDPADWDSYFVKNQIRRHNYMLEAQSLASEADIICAADRPGWYDKDPRLSAIHYSDVIARALTRVAASGGDISGAVDSLKKRLKIANTLLRTGRGSGEFGTALSLMYEALGQMETVLLEEEVKWEGVVRSLYNSMKYVGEEFNESQRREILGLYSAMKSYISVFPESKWGSECAFYNFKPNRTLNIFAGKTRMALKQIGQPFAARIPIRHEINSELAVVLGANWMGQSLLFSEVPNIDYRGYTIIIARCDILWTMAALRSFHFDKGQLPESLGDLIPVYLDEVPADRFDGKPLRYSRKQAKVWCVGRDLIDDGGIETEETKFSLMPDPLMRLEWLAESPEKNSTKNFLRTRSGKGIFCP